MTLNSQVMKGVAWLSAFKLISQTVSWATTIYVARILTARDYGLMEMATVFTGYIEFFVEFGISAAIINKKELKESELSTIFWFLLIWGILLGSSCLVIAPITAWYFKNQNLIGITSTVGILFIISSLVILPRSLLHREMRFKEVGSIDAFSIFCACTLMIYLAYHNAGVWTLLLGTIARESIRLVCLYFRVTFRPLMHFSLNELKPIVKFGAPVVASSSLFYIYNKSDRFFGGRALGDYKLGFYAIALQLAAMPVEKILSIFQSAIYPAFSRLKDDPIEFNKLFLKFVNVIYTVILPLFVGGFLLADLLIPTILGEKWRDSILPFKYLVIAQLFVSLGAPLNIIHLGRGKPSWTFWSNALLTPLMFIGFYFSSSLNSPALLALPWVTIYPLFIIIYLIYSLKALEIPMSDYILSIKHSILATLTMTAAILAFRNFQLSSLGNIAELIILTLIGALSYTIYILVFSRTTFKQLKNL